MKHRWTHRLTVGFLGIATILIAMWGCGRERVNPVDSNFEGGSSAALNPPDNIRAQGTIGRIALNWAPVNNANLAGYGVYRATSATGEFARLRGEASAAEVTTARTTFVDSTLDLSVAKIYFYKLKTVDVDGEASEFSTFVSAEALDDTRAPGAPTNFLAITDVNNAQVTLGWSAPEMDEGNAELTGLSGYKIFRIKDSQGKLQVQGSQEALIALISDLGIDLNDLGQLSEELTDIFVQFGTVPSGQTFFVDTDRLEVGVLYVYLVTAVDPAGNTGRAAIALVTVQAPGADLPMPANLRATQNQQARIVVSWNPVANPDLLGYLVLRSQSTQGPFNPVTEDTLFTTGQTQYVDSLVVAEAVYFYKVQTVVQDPQHGVLRSDASTFIDGRAIADESSPGTPSDLIVSLDEDHFQRVTLNWTAPTQDRNGGDLTGLASFEIFRSRDNNTSFALLATVSSNQVRFVDTSVELLTTYFYAIRAVDPSGNAGPRSQAVAVTTKGFAVPRNVRAVGGEQKITLSWMGNTEPELTGYEILRFADPTDATPQRVFNSVLTTYVDSPVVAGQPFVYRVRAVGASNVKSDLSAFVSAQAAELVPVLAAPRNVRAVGGEQKITLSWMGNTEAELTGYRVSRYTNPAQTTPQATFRTVQTTYVDSPVVAGQTFVYRVQAIGANGEESELSQYVAAQAEELVSPVLTAPRNVRAVGGIGQITISWNANSEPELTGYRVSRYTDPAQTMAEATFITVQTTYVDSPLAFGQTFVYRVQAIGANDEESELSQYDAAVVSVDQSPPAVPGNLSANAEGGTAVELRWNAPKTDANNRDLTGLTGYVIYRGTSGGDGLTELVRVDAAERRYFDREVEENTAYTYQITAIDAHGNESARSDLVTARTEAGVVPARDLRAAYDSSTEAVTLNWVAPRVFDSFIVERAELPAGSASSQNLSYQTLDSAHSSTSYVDSGVASRTTYVYRVRVNLNGQISDPTEREIVVIP